MAGSVPPQEPPSKPRYAPAERIALATALTEVGPDAPTLCQGWASRDLAAHVVIRERRPLAAVGILFPPMAKRTERIMNTTAAGDYRALVDLVRHPSTWGPARFAVVEEAMNLVEFFVHTEDVRRAQPGWRRRPTGPGFDAALWRRVPTLARGRFARFPAMIPGPRLDPATTTVLVQANGHGQARVGKGTTTVTITGAPPELVLFLFGRTSVAEVVVDGPPELVKTLKNPGA
jgi:uncharacterized protein (TIGR03085 family)